MTPIPVTIASSSNSFSICYAYFTNSPNVIPSYLHALTRYLSVPGTVLEVKNEERGSGNVSFNKLLAV